MIYKPLTNAVCRALGKSSPDWDFSLLKRNALAISCTHQQSQMLCGRTQSHTQYQYQKRRNQSTETYFHSPMSEELSP